MDDLSETTIETYRKNFDTYVERTPSELRGEFKEWMDYFLSHVADGGNVFELGSVFGRDARYMREKGFTVLCTDVIPQALKKLSADGFKTAEFDFRNNPRQEWLGTFDGVLANAVLLHAPAGVFENTLHGIRMILKKNGIAAVSLKTGNGEEISYEKMDAPRYFLYHSEPEIREMAGKLSFEIINISYADNGKWLQVVMRKI